MNIRYLANNRVILCNTIFILINDNRMSGGINLSLSSEQNRENREEQCDMNVDQLEGCRWNTIGIWRNKKTCLITLHDLISNDRCFQPQVHTFHTNSRAMSFEDVKHKYFVDWELCIDFYWLNFTHIVCVCVSTECSISSSYVFRMFQNEIISWFRLIHLQWKSGLPAKPIKLEQVLLECRFQSKSNHACIFIIRYGYP